ncbi:nucleic acid-binding protein [Streptomyces anulatus]|uniref:nucleic acid-binding protein n=1 Tax=Streptomyces anulatus TaxID=1892 RepID=UPI003658C3BE
MVSGAPAGWEAEKQLHSGFRPSKTDSPGYTEEQHAEAARFRAELLKLTSTVSTHPFWEQVEQGQVVDARRIRLKHQHEVPEAA